MTANEFKNKYFSLHTKLFKIAFVILKNKDDAEDIVQDAYCKLWNERSKLNSVKQPEAFCITMVKNLCIDFLRSPKSEAKENVLDKNVLDENTPDNELEAKDMLHRVKIIMGHLPKKQRRILELRCFADCSFEEIETFTGESSANVRVLLSRARNYIKSKIAW